SWGRSAPDCVRCELHPEQPRCCHRNCSQLPCVSPGQRAGEGGSNLSHLVNVQSLQFGEEGVDFQVSERRIVLGDRSCHRPLARFQKIDRRRRKRMAVNSFPVCFAPASGTSSNLGRRRFFTFPARTMALRSAPGLSKRRTDQPLSLNPIAISSAVGSDFRSRQTFTMTRPLRRKQRRAASKNAASFMWAGIFSPVKASTMSTSYCRRFFCMYANPSHT